ncbi:hypothetical protein pdam_00006541 [Pocillopora damicornis]|uniref:Protein kinase domain-containing protein n=1 Tax=Pocillopora damicornis TaxID=46731 RepID=A0A3M6THQ5_POCDA|nr:hypothetical protein pdam_00006541 [Pocillopora damicornis]
MRRNTLKQTEGLIVAVKMLHGMADNDQRREFLEEIQLMKAVGTHKNIVNMLAARNVLVGDNKIAKVADFGLTRHVYEEKVYHAKRNRKLPLKWMSVEAIFDQTFTTQSDVWNTIPHSKQQRVASSSQKWISDGKARHLVLDESRDYYNVPSFNSLIDESEDDVFEKEEGYEGKGMADNDQRREFLEEIQLMKAVGTHKNIVNMLGCCTVEEPMFLLVEYIPYGDLLHYLRKRRGKTTRSDCIYVNNTDAPKGDDGNIQILSFTQSAKIEERGRENLGMNQDEVHEDAEDDEETLTPGDLLAFAWQISEGMEYLARKGFVHRDLAARNVLVGDNKIAKVADFGLTRHVYEEKVYHAKRNRKLPLKWMSVEAIFDQTFTAQSDVWAFGVLLWELVTLGGTPYPTVNNRELLRLLKDGYRMEKPDICNDEMYKMMRECWLENPFDRPTFTLIRERLEEMMQKDNPYLDLSVLDESQDCYNVPSFNSLVDESEDEVFDKEEGYDLLEEDHKEIINDKDQPIKDSNKNETASSPKSSKFPGEEENDEPVDVDKIDFNNIAFQSNDLNNLKEVKVDFDALEMALYRHGGRRFVF